MEKLPASVLVDKKRDLINTAGIANFQKSLESSNGSALIIVHPFFPEITHGLTNNYAVYRERLEKSVSKYQSLKIPIVFMEGHPISDGLGVIFKRLKVEPADIYMVETKHADPMPQGTDLLDFSRKLKDAGLRRATVSGSNLWLKRRDIAMPLCNSHPLRKKYHLYGCVAEVLKTFSTAGIYAVPGFATYPGRLDKGFRSWS